VFLYTFNWFLFVDHVIALDKPSTGFIPQVSNPYIGHCLCVIFPQRDLGWSDQSCNQFDWSLPFVSPYSAEAICIAISGMDFCHSSASIVPESL
jgi:hypothetical protein